MSEKKKGKLSKDYIGAGIALGTAFGAVFGETIFGSTGTGIGVCIAIGAAIGAARGGASREPGPYLNKATSLQYPIPPSVASSHA